MDPAWTGWWWLFYVSSLLRLVRPHPKLAGQHHQHAHKASHRTEAEELAKRSFRHDYLTTYGKAWGHASRMQLISDASQRKLGFEPNLLQRTGNNKDMCGFAAQPELYMQGHIPARNYAYARASASPQLCKCRGNLPAPNYANAGASASPK